MCFSASASFVASGFLAGMSVFSGYKVGRHKPLNRAKLALVGVPAAFAIQQFSEGLIWLSAANSSNLMVANLAVYIFSFFAFVFWPAYIPTCIYLVEKQPSHRHWLVIVRNIGFLFAAFLLFNIYYYGVQAELSGCHVLYHFGLLRSPGWLAWLGMFIYLATTVGALLLSSWHVIWRMGVLIGFAYIVSLIFYHTYLVSVWCFFAAIISLLLDRIVLHRLS